MEKDMKKILMAVSALAILASIPAYAETAGEAASRVEAKTENALNKAGDAIERGAEKAKAATKDAYSDVKAYFTDEKNVSAVTDLKMSSVRTADKLIGATVQDPAGKNIGKIEDALVSRDGDIERVIINDGGVLGLGGKLVSFDDDVIEGTRNNEDIVVKLNEESIKNAAAFDYDKSMPAGMYSVKKLIGAKVLDDKGKNIGTVDTLAFDGDEADYVVVSFNKILGLGGDKAAMDFKALNIADNAGKYSFKLNAEQSAQFNSFKQSTKAN